MKETEREGRGGAGREGGEGRGDFLKKMHHCAAKNKRNTDETSQ